MKRFTLHRHYQDHDDRPGEPFVQTITGIPERSSAAQLSAEYASRLCMLAVGQRFKDADGYHWERTV